jgi:Ni/Co efflux regulator RcnB
MKLFTTAAMALALTGAAAAAYADNPNDQKGQQHQAQPHGGQGGGQQHGGQGGGQHNAGGAQGGPQHFNGQAQGGAAHGGPGQGGPAQGGPGQGGVQRFNGQAFQRGQGQGQAQGGQHFNGQAVQGGGQQQWQGRGGAQGQGQNGQVQRWNGGGGQGGQRFNGQGGQRFNGQGSGGNFGFQNHGLRGRDQGRSFYSANSFARQYRAQRRFRFSGHSVFPSGWSYRPWYFGEFLPLGWYSSQYYLDWADYGLPPPPVGCEWIAEGPDAVLVDVWTGEVLSVYQGVFYWNGY